MNLKLKLAILESGRSQKQVAEIARLPESYLSMAVRGKFILNEAQKRRIAKTLRKPEAELFS